MKLTLRGCEWIFVSIVFTLGKSPGPLILFRPYRSAGMNEKDLYPIFVSSIHQQAGAALHSFCLWHQISLLVWLRLLLCATTNQWALLERAGFLLNS